jgi:hypothetical protein
LQDAAAGAITIRWELDRAGTSFLEYSSGGEAPRRAASAFEGRKHRVRLTGLRPGEKYRYRVWTKDERVTDEYEFRATPSGPTPFSFAVFGDFGAGTRGQLGVAKLLDESPAEFALLTGDIVYGGGEEENYDLRFFKPYRKALRRMTFWPALGNHDVAYKDGAAALAVFDVPRNGPEEIQAGRNYSFDYGNAHFAALDSNAGSFTLRRVIGPWLERDLAASKQPWKFVFFHHAPYSSATHGENAPMRDLITPIFARTGVDVVFTGHDHCYERTKPIHGVTYVVSGNGGQTLYPRRYVRDYTEVFYNEKHGLTSVTIDGDRLLLKHVNVDGKEIDRYERTKGAGR